MAVKDYRDSHTAPEKGRTYDQSFHDLPYRRTVWGWEKKTLKKIVERVSLSHTKIVYLDFACGTGRIAGYMEDLVSESVGVDVSESMLEIARKNVKKTRVVNADLTAQDPLEMKKFDVVTAFRFFLNAQPELRASVMNVLAAKLNPEGVLVFNIHMNRGCLLDRMIRLYQRFKKAPDGEYHVMSIAEVRQLVRGAGLEIVETHHFGILPVLREQANIPTWLLDLIEKPAARIAWMRPWARYVIYVCKAVTEGA